MQAVLFDLDGVLYQADAPIAGAAETLAWVEQRRIPHLFVTNTSSRPRAALVEKLSDMGLPVAAEQLLTPAVAAAGWLAQHGERPAALFVPEATRVEFAAIEVLDAAAGSGAGAVVIGDLGRDWDFDTLNRAFRLLMARPAPALVALGMTRYWQARDGLRLDVGAFVSALATASAIEPTVIGKPAAAFFEQALARLGTAPHETVMIGDDVVGDVGGAQDAGLTGVLVRSGKFRQADPGRGIEPAAVLDSIASLPDWWSEQAPN